MRTVHLRASKADVVEKVRLLAPILAGGAGDPTGGTIAYGFSLDLGMTCMGFIKPAFVTKARGGTDEAGLKWDDLAPSTIRKRMNKGANLKITQRKRHARQRLIKAIKKFRSTDTFRKGLIAEARGRKAAEQYRQAYERHNRAVGSIEILRDSGRMFNSFSPGVTGQLMPGGILDVFPGYITFGTNVHYAKYHHSDEPRKIGKNDKPILPQRRLWAKPSQWPAAWWNQLHASARRGAVAALRILLGAQ